MKNLTTRRSVMLGVTLSLLMLASSVSLAQSIKGRISFGFNAGGNKYYGNFTDSRFNFGGEAFIRWNMMDHLSLHAAYNAGQLRWKPKAAPAFPANDVLAETAQVADELNHTRYGGWDLMLSYNVFPEETFVPYVIAGIEALNFEPKNSADNPLPNNRQDASGTERYAKNVFGGVMGVGFEMYISEKVTFNGRGLIHLTGTDWIDDYSDPGNSRQDAFVTMGLGFSYYIFAPELQPTVETDRGGNVTNITNVYNTSAPIIVKVTDTVYKTRVIKGAIYDFPGTLFIVNTDEFNMAVPGNMQNLYNIKTLLNQCSELRVEIAGHASHEGTVARNHELSHMRAERVKKWLIDQGVNPNKIVGTPGLGTSDDAVHEPTNVSAEELEAARVLNRRISVRVVEGCN